MLKHYALPGIGFLMNLGELFGVVYLAVKSGGDASKEAYYALATVLVWIVVGAVWVVANPKMRGVKMMAEPARATLSV